MLSNPDSGIMTAATIEHAIMQFKDEYAWLSNFEPCEVVLDGASYPSVENAYQAAKTLDLAARELFLNVHAGKAKRLGKKLVLREDWERVRLTTMHDLLEQKFSQQRFASLLLSTGDAKIIEGNTWGDTYWGLSLKTGQGQNHLGEHIMRIRKRLVKNH